MEPKTLEELERLQLALLHEKSQRVLIQLNALRLQEQQLRAENKKLEADFKAFTATLTARYKLSASDSLDLETGAITRAETQEAPCQPA